MEVIKGLFVLGFGDISHAYLLCAFQHGASLATIKSQFKNISKFKIFDDRIHFILIRHHIREDSHPFLIPSHSDGVRPAAGVLKAWPGGPYYNKEICGEETGEKEKENGPCSLERCRKKKMKTVTSGQMLEACLMPATLVKAVRSRHQGPG